jgi:hypothetical protein
MWFKTLVFFSKTTIDSKLARMGSILQNFSAEGKMFVRKKIQESLNLATH